MLLSRIEKFIDARLEMTEVEGLEPKLPKPKAGQKKSFGKKRKPNVRFKKRGQNAYGGQGRGQGQSQRRRRSPSSKAA